MPRKQRSTDNENAEADPSTQTPSSASSENDSGNSTSANVEETTDRTILNPILVAEMLPDPTHALTQLIVALQMLPVKTLMRNGRRAGLETIIDLIEQYLQYLHTTDGVAESLLEVLESGLQAQIEVMRADMELAASTTSTAPLPQWQSTTAVDQAMAYLLALGVPDSVLARVATIRTAGFGGGLPATDVLPGGVAATIPPPAPLSSSQTPTAALLALQQQSASSALLPNVPKKDHTVFRTSKSITPISKLTDETISRYEREVAIETASGIITPFSQIFSRDLQLWIQNMMEEPDGHSISEWLTWPPDLLIRTLRRATSNSTSQSSSSALDVADQAVATLNNISTPAVGDSDSQSNADWVTQVLGILDRAFGQDFLLNTPVTEAQKIASSKVIQELQRQLNKCKHTVVGANVVMELIAQNASKMPFSSWFKQFKLHYNRYKGIVEEFERAKAQADKSNKSANRNPKTQDNAEPKLKRAKSEGNTKPQRAPAQPAPLNSVACYKCGRSNHAASTCRLTPGTDRSKWHPDTNWHASTPWSESQKGRAWRAKGEQFCSMTKTLSGGTWDGFATTSSSGEPVDTSIAHSTSSSLQCNSTRVRTRRSKVLHRPCSDKYEGTPLIEVCILPTHTHPNSKPIRLDALMDSGSFAEGSTPDTWISDSYISQAGMDQLAGIGYQVVKTSAVEVEGYQGNPERVDTYVEVSMCVVCTRTSNNLKQFFKIKLLVLPELHHSIILGFQTIRQQQTLLKRMAHALGVGLTSGSSTSATDNNGIEMLPVSRSQARGGGHDPNHEPQPRNRSRETVLSLNVVSAGQPCSTSTRSRIFRARNMSARAIRRRSSLLSAKQLGLNRDTPTQMLDGFTPNTLKGSSVAAVNKLNKLLYKYKRVFSRELGRNSAHITPMHIILRGDAIWGCSATQAPARLQSREKAAEIIKQVEAMLAAGVIRLSTANAHSQVMLTPKKDNKWRFCIDYRRLNLATRPEGWPLPRIQDMIQRIGAKRCKYFGTLDATKGYYQAPLAESSKQLTAFITPGGLYEWNRVAMGLRGAPSYFQKAMCTEVLNGLLYNICELYLDDIIIFGETEEQFRDNLEQVLERLHSKNIFINPDKCQLGLTEIEYVGHTISEDGVQFSREKLHKAVQISKPIRMRDLKSFLGLANYFRAHVRNHSSLAQPLNDMLKDYQPKKVLQWDDISLKAFEDLKQAVNDAPKLFFVDENLPVHLYTDASLNGVGAYLCQIREDGTEIPIAFYSRSLRAEERKWGIPCLEAYAIWQAFRHMDYLLRDAKTFVHTDHKNLTFIKESGSEKVIRWKLDLMEYDMELDYIKGEDNPIADFWSRNDAAEEHDCVVEDARKATHILSSLTQLPADILQQEISDRKNCRHFLGSKKQRKISDYSIPQEAYDAILAVHDDVTGHHGVDQTLSKLAKKNEKWPMMRDHVRKFIHECDSCQKRSLEQYDVRAPHYAIGKYQPMDSVSLDLIGPLAEGPTGNLYILVCIDSFTRYVWCRAIQGKDAKTVAAAYLDHLGHFGAPYEFKSDGGKEFANKVMDELVQMVGSTKVTTFAYSHQSNGLIERANKEIVRWIETMVYNKRLQHNDWELALPFAVRIHNASPIATIQYAPADLLYGISNFLDRNILVPKDNVVAETTLSSWGKDRRAMQDLMIQRAQAQQCTAHAKRTDKPDTSYTTFRNGEYVLLAYPESSVWKRSAPTKLAMTFRGPFKVLSHEGTTYTLLNLTTNQQFKKMVFHLRPYRYDAARVDPKQMALKDHQGEFYVEQVLSHTGSWAKKSSLRFTVKWIGYPEPEPDQLWADLKHVQQLHDYMRQINQERHIPIMDDSDSDDDEEVQVENRRTRRRL